MFSESLNKMFERELESRIGEIQEELSITKEQLSMLMIILLY
jgi:hypothetical protein